MNLLQSFVIAMSMYSKIPMPAVEWKKENMKYAMCFFPLVGVVIGAAVYLAGRLFFGLHCQPLMRGAVCTLVPILISGGIHMDGFMDTMDALASYGDKEKKLAILKDSHAGAFAILGLGCHLVWSLAVWGEIPEEMLGVAALSFVVSRSLSGYSVVTFPAARENGLARTFQDQAEKKRVKITMLVFLILAAAGMCAVHLRAAAGALLAEVLVFWYYKKMSTRQFGGVTGDLAGYFLEISELAMLTGMMLTGGYLWN